MAKKKMSRAEIKKMLEGHAAEHDDLHTAHAKVREAMHGRHAKDRQALHGRQQKERLALYEKHTSGAAKKPNPLHDHPRSK